MGNSPFSRRDRDAGLDRVSSLTRWTVAVALAATGFFAGLASQAGRGSATAASKTRHRSTVTPTRRSDDDGYGFSQPTPVTAAPQQQPLVLPAPSQSVSGGFAPIVSGAS